MLKDLDSIHPELALDEDAVENASDDSTGDETKPLDDNGSDTDTEALADTANTLNEDDTVEESHIAEIVEQPVVEKLVVDKHAAEESTTDTSVSPGEDSEQLGVTNKQVFNA